MKIKKLLLPILFSLFALKSIAQNERNGHNVVLHQPPEVDFSWVNACLGDTTYFLNGSIRGTTFQWYIYDKNLAILDSSTNFNIAYKFSVADTFFVFLQADNGHIASSSQMVIIDTVLTCDFNFMHCSNQFMNHSTCATSFFWNFGDGSTSTAQTPTHLYADTGYYTVKFIAYKGAQSDTAIKQIFVDPIAFPSGVITYTISGDTLFVHAADSSAGLFYNWKFGDGTPNILGVRDTFHVYSNPGTYVMYFVEWNTCLQDNRADTIVILPLNSVQAISLNNLSLTVFPNPIRNGELLNVEYRSPIKNAVSFIIYNSVGEKVMESNQTFTSVTNEFKIDISSLPPGLYILTAGSAGGKSRAKFIISGS